MSETTDDFDLTRPRVRQTAGAYELSRVIGSGGFGTVFEARHRSTGRLCAIKRLSITRQDAERFQKEALYPAQAAAQSLHVLDVRDLFEDESGFYLVMELVPHGDLRRVMETTAQPMPVRDALEIGLGVARGLAAIHAAGIIHRDLKPSNVLMARLDDRWVPKIADFGLARSAESLSIGDFASSGYAAPEQVDLGSEGVGAAADLFALGMLLYELLTGANASGRSDLREYARWIATHVSPSRSGGPPDVAAMTPSHRRPELKEWPEVDALVTQLLQAAPAQRPTAKTVVATLEWATTRVAGERGSPVLSVPPALPDSTSATTTATTATKPGSGRQALTYAIAAIVLIAAGAGAFLLGNHYWQAQRSTPRATASVKEAGQRPVTATASGAATARQAGEAASRRTAVTPRVTQPPSRTGREQPVIEPPPPSRPAAPESTPAALEATPVAPTRTAAPAAVPASPVADEGVRAVLGTWMGGMRFGSTPRPDRMVLTLQGTGPGTVSYSATPQTECVTVAQWVRADASGALLSEQRLRGNCLSVGRLEVVRATSDAVDVVWSNTSGLRGFGRLMTPAAYDAQTSQVVALFDRWKQIRENPDRSATELPSVFPTADMTAYKKYDDGVDHHAITMICGPVAFVGNDAASVACDWNQTTTFKRRAVTGNGRTIQIFGTPPPPRKTTEHLLVSLRQRSGSWAVDHLTQFR